jgi:hypothetical protein
MGSSLAAKWPRFQKLFETVSPPTAGPISVLICYNVLGEIKLDGRRRSSMDPSRKANREGHEKTLQYKSQQEALGVP